MMNFYRNLPVLITGGAGFIGSHLAENLANLGAKVTILDNLSSGNVQNLKKLKRKVNFINGDIRNFDNCLQATKDIKIVFHAAALVSVPESMQNPQLCHEININGTFNLLESARINNVEKFIFSSSSAVYGNKEGIILENDSCNPASIYGLSKLIGELYCKKYFECFGLKTISLRYFNVYGARQNPNGEYAGVYAKFMHCIKNNKQITIYGDGLQTRDFISVDQVVKANLSFAMLNGELNGQAINIASGKSITLIELFEKLKAEFQNYKQEIQFKPARIGDIRHSQADCSKFKRLILKEI